MLTKLFCATLQGTEAKIIEVEISFSAGLPQTVIVGLADTSIKEAKERVRACLKNSEFQFPLGRISINLAPANIFKYGTQFDLPIALGILLASEQIRIDASNKIFLGELGFNGLIKPISGVLPMVLQAKAAGFKAVFVSIANYSEANLVQGIDIIPLENLGNILDYFSGKYNPEVKDKIKFVSQDSPVDFADIAGQGFAKRGVEIAVAGGHNILFTGPPGSGKTMLAQAASSILPQLEIQQLLEVAKIYSAAGLFENKFISKPFRNPTPSVTLSAFVGGGRIPKPGEISLAHNGILFLDEFAEFPRAVLENLRQPLESGKIQISRMQNNFVFPARFILIAAQNPCPCGYYGVADKNCVCSAAQINSYQRKVSGPILDRIDLQVYMRRIDLFATVDQSEKSADILKRIKNARAVQYQRLHGKLNSEINAAELKSVCALERQAKEILVAANEKYKFSGRSVNRILKVARTIADLENSPHILTEHITEALQYRIAE